MNTKWYFIISSRHVIAKAKAEQYSVIFVDGGRAALAVSENVMGNVYEEVVMYILYGVLRV